MKQRIKIGDIVEIQTQTGKSYAQYYHHHATPLTAHGALLRILPGFFSERPTDFHDLAAKKEKFSTFFPVQAAVNRSLVYIVANEEVPPFARTFPIFRAGFRNPATGTVEVWWLWDGMKEWKVGKLTDEQLDFPLRGIPSYPTLVEKIEEGWMPRRDEEFIAKARAKSIQNTKAPDGAKVVEEIRHYLIFGRRDGAEKAATIIRALNLQVSVTDLGENWGVNVLQQTPTDEIDDKLAERLQEVASTLGGIYDGSQVRIAL